VKKISVDSALSKAKLCVKRNELLEARKLYQAVLIAFPKNKTARQALASLNNRKQLGGDQNPPKEITQELITLYNQGRLALVVDKAKALLKLYPRSSIVWNILGTSAAQIGKLSQAIDAFKKTAILQPKDAEPHFNMGTAFQDKGKLAEAVKAYRKALSLKADYAKAFNNMGTALHDQGKLEEALEAYKNVISLKPNDALVIINMGAVLQDLGKLEEAVRVYKNALSINSNDADLYYNLGNALSDQSKLEEAVKAYNNALSIKPDYVEALNNMGTSFRHQGKQKEALSAYNKVLSLNPNHFGAHRNLSTLVTYKKDNPQINKIKELMNHSDLSADSRCLLHYTYAKINEDLGDLEKAFDHYAIGGALRKKQLAYDIGQDQRLFKKIKTVAPKLLEHSLTETVRKLDITPIFILGMPRSGTTLVEQIISCHSQVHGAGELPLLARFSSSIMAGKQDVSVENLQEVRKNYLDGLKKVSEGKFIVTDKMPHNFMYIGLICNVFPEAKIVHVRRNPAATCLSNFKHYFNSRGLGYPNDIKDIVNYFELYCDLMRFWDESYRNKIYHLDYDKLTLEQEVETKSLMSHLNLNWEASCLSPHKNNRIVRTASHQQVRQKIYRDSSQAWRKFQPYLGGAFDELIGISD